MSERETMDVEEMAQRLHEHKFVTGDYIYASWGYDQTQVDYARIIEVSDTRKTVVCRMCKIERVGSTQGHQDMVVPTETYGDEFRLHVRELSDGEPCFRGSYPYCNDARKESGTRRDTFFLWDGKPKGQTDPQFRH